MGFNVGALSRVPLEIYDHYIFVVGDPEINAHAKWVQHNFAELARSLPAKTAIVAGTDRRLSSEVAQLIGEWGDGWRNDNPAGSDLFALLADGTTLIIAKGNIRTTKEPLVMVPLSLAGVFDNMEPDEGALEEFMSKVFKAICEAIRDGKLNDLVDQLGASHIPLKPLPGGMIVTTLKRANEVLHLKPNLLGFGFNLNAAIDAWLGAIKVSR
jgi:hypothetical protein